MVFKHDRREFISRGAGMCAAGGLAALASPIAFAKDSSRFYNLPPGGVGNARKLVEAPRSIVTDGRINLGVFYEPVREMNLDDADLFRKGVKGPLRRMRMQEFIGWGVALPDWHVGLIIIDIQLMCMAGFYVMNRKTGESYQWEYYGGHKNIRLARTTWNDVSFAKKEGFDFRFEHGLDQGCHKIRFHAKETRKKPAILLEANYYEDLTKVQPLVVSLPVEPSHYFYTQKCAAPVGGRLTVGNESFDIDPARDSGTMDEHRNYYPFPNNWFFGCFSGFDKKGRLIGANMCDNIIRDQEHWNENCLWVGDKISLLGPISFDVDLKHPERPWRMREKYGRLDVTITPEGGNQPVVIPPAGFTYYQKCGPYHGFAIDDSGEKHEIDGYFGEAEDFELGHYLRSSG